MAVKLSSMITLSKVLKTQKAPEISSAFGNHEIGFSLT
jgi:hypothetical protein